MQQRPVARTKATGIPACSKGPSSHDTPEACLPGVPSLSWPHRVGPPLLTGDLEAQPNSRGIRKVLEDKIQEVAASQWTVPKFLAVLNGTLFHDFDPLVFVPGVNVLGTVRTE